METLAKNKPAAKAKKYLKEFYWKDYLNIILGLALYSIGLMGFIAPHKFVTGGLAGVGLIVSYATNGAVSVSMTLLLINACLLTIALFVLGGKFVAKTTVGVLGLVGLLALMEYLLKINVLPAQGLIQGEPLMSGIIGAMICGVGVGLVINANGTTGGTDTIIAIVNKFKTMAFGRGMLLLDFIVICSSLLIPERQGDYIAIIHGLIIMGVMTYTLDLTINGFRQSVQFLIISKKYPIVADMITKELKRGCTVMDGTGWYTQEESKVILLLARRNQATQIVRAIKSIDPNAFISQSVVRGVFGEGFDKM